VGRLFSHLRGPQACFLHQDKTADGRMSRFFKLVRRDAD
jgi:hypothetical protein